MRGVMKTRFLKSGLLVLYVVLMTSVHPQIARAKTLLKSQPLPEQQRQFLKSVGPSLRSWQTFAEWTASLKGAGIADIYSTDATIKKTKFEPLVDAAYKMTFAEIFETMARQSKSTLRYDLKSQRWVFDKPQMPPSYSISVADGWKVQDRGLYVAYIPSIAPVGMDIYMMGRFAGLSEERLKEIRDEQAVFWADRVHNGATVDDMSIATVDGVQALYYWTKAPVKGKQWRQWAFVKDGQSFVIVSTVDDENESKLIPDVEKMVRSFHVVQPAAPCPGY